MTTFSIEKPNKLLKNIVLSLFIYALPVALMTAWFAHSEQKPWELPLSTPQLATDNSWLQPITLIFNNLNDWGLTVLVLILGIIEFSIGLYDKRWNTNERTLDIACFVFPKLVLYPLTAYYGSKFLPYAIPELKNIFSWVPFWWGFAILAVADDLTQYWYHRLHHEVPFLWRFHRTHHSAPYMGMAMAGRQNIIYTFFFSQIYVTTTLVYLGLGFPAIFVRGIKSLITTLAHSSIKWDKPLYEINFLKPIGWVLERVISTPATHHAHHSDSNDDGVGHYKGNFGNMFFLWDLIFGTGIITRKYPQSYGIKSYQQEEWYAQFAWPIFKSKKEGSELSSYGPEVMIDEAAISLKLSNGVIN
ncbi:MAG: sterol desaturase family protein [Cytophagales bacterium]|nr:sterol desaturase family protein [Cytophagales bacterium]